MESKSEYPRVGHLVDGGPGATVMDAADVVELSFGRLLMVAEGMGPDDAGNEPASVVLDSLTRYLQEARVDPNLPDAVRNHLKGAMLAANRQLMAAGKVSRSMKGAVVSLIVVLVIGDRAYVGCSGVARLYLVRDGVAARVTRFDDAERSGPPTPLGIEKNVEPLVMGTSISFQAGDALALSSGGLCDVVTDEEIAELVLGFPAEVSCIKLAELGLGRGGKRNIAVVAYQSSAPHMKPTPKKVEAREVDAASPTRGTGRTVGGWVVTVLVALGVAGAVFGAVHLARTFGSKTPEEGLPVASAPAVEDVEASVAPLAREKLKDDPYAATKEILEKEVARRERKAAAERVKAAKAAADLMAAAEASSDDGLGVAAAARKAAAEKAANEKAAAEKLALAKAAAENQAAKAVAENQSARALARNQAAKASADKALAEKAAAKAAADKALAEKAAAKAAADKVLAEKEAAEKAASAQAAAAKKAAELAAAGTDPLERCVTAGLDGGDRSRVGKVREQLVLGWKHLKRRKGREAAQAWNKIRPKMKHGSAKVQEVCGPAVEAYRTELYREYLRLARFFTDRKRCGPARARAADARVFGAPEAEVKATIAACYEPPK